MITYEYINIDAPIDYQTFKDKLTEFGAVGWRFVTVYNGQIFFERRVKTKIG